MKLNKFSSLFESSNTPVIAVLESAEILGEDNALVEATLIQADGIFYGIKSDGSIHEAMRKSNRHFKLFAESLKDAPQWLVSESEKYKTDEGDEAAFQAYKDKMMKKHGFTDWEEASKDKDFMNALDRGWNAEDEKGKDGLNEGDMSNGDLVRTKYGRLKVKIKNGNAYLPRNFDKASEFIMKTLGVDFATIISNHNASGSNDSYGSIMIEGDKFDDYVDWVWHFDQGKVELINKYNLKHLNFKSKMSPSYKGLNENFVPKFTGAKDMNNILGIKAKVIGDTLFTSDNMSDKIISLLKRWKFTPKGRAFKDGSESTQIWSNLDGSQEVTLSIDPNEMKLSVTIS